MSPLGIRLAFVTHHRRIASSGGCRFDSGPILAGVGPRTNPPLRTRLDKTHLIDPKVVNDVASLHHNHGRQSQPGDTPPHIEKVVMAKKEESKRIVIERVRPERHDKRVRLERPYAPYAIQCLVQPLHALWRHQASRAMGISRFRAASGGQHWSAPPYPSLSRADPRRSWDRCIYAARPGNKNVRASARRGRDRHICSPMANKQSGLLSQCGSISLTSINVAFMLRRNHCFRIINLNGDGAEMCFHFCLPGCRDATQHADPVGESSKGIDTSRMVDDGWRIYGEGWIGI